MYGLLVTALIFLCGVYGGFNIRNQLDQQFSLASRVQFKLNTYYKSIFKAGEIEETLLTTNRVTLRTQSNFLPISVALAAGGISTVGRDHVLVLDRLGKIFSFTNGVTTLLSIVTPDFNVEDLELQQKKGLLGDAEINYDWFRYNDILYLEDQNKKLILISYTEWDSEKLCFYSTLAKLAVEGVDPSRWSAGTNEWSIVARTRPCLKTLASGWGVKGLEAGGRLAHLEGSRVVWTSGGYERDDNYDVEYLSRTLAQDDKTDYGKVLLVDIATGAVEAIAKGLRNPQGVTISPDGDIWVTDHGMRGGDELNLVFKGANFGFPAATLGTRYNRKPAGSRPYHAGHEAYDAPVVAFVPSVAPSSALWVEGFHYAWDGSILVGALTRSLQRVYLENGRVLFVEPIDIGVRVRDLDQLSDGRLVIWTDDRRLMFISPKEGPNPYEVFDSYIASLENAQTRAAVTNVYETCLQCHGIGEGEARTSGPTLYRICGASPGTGDYTNYSGALSSIEGVWSVETLSAFITDPASVAPDSTMAWGGLDDEAIATILAHGLCSMSE